MSEAEVTSQERPRSARPKRVSAYLYPGGEGWVQERELRDVGGCRVKDRYAAPEMCDEAFDPSVAYPFHERQG